MQANMKKLEEGGVMKKLKKRAMARRKNRRRSQTCFFSEP